MGAIATCALHLLVGVSSSVCFLVAGYVSRWNLEDEVPAEVAGGWTELASSRPKLGVTQSTQTGALGQLMWDETIKTSASNILIDARTTHGAPEPQLLVRGPRHKFVVDLSAGGQNVVEMVERSQNLSEYREDILGRAEVLLSAPFAIYGTPLSEFFKRCQIDSISRLESNTLRIAFSAPSDGSFPIKPECTDVHGSADFDGDHGWRLVRFDESFVAPNGVRNHLNTLMHYDPVDPWKYDIEVTNADTGALAWRTSVQPLAEHPTPEEFTVEHYGIVVHPESSSAWWRRPSVWIGILAVVLLSTAAWLRRTKNG